MATISQRGVLRALPALIALILALLFAPGVPALPPAGGPVTGAATAIESRLGTSTATSSEISTEVSADPSSIEQVEETPPAAASDDTLPLVSRHTAGGHGSRAPPLPVL